MNAMTFKIHFAYSSMIAARVATPKCLAVLTTDNWDDFTFKTMFSLSVFDENGNYVECGTVKIGFKGQSIGRTSEKLILPKEELPEEFFSLGQDVEYYKNINNKLSKEFAESLLAALRDVVFDKALLSNIESEEVFKTSLTRDLRVSMIEGQFRRVLEGGAPLTDFKFSYRDPGSEKTAKIDLFFNVTNDSKPSSNIHVLIGRNGVGKTTLLNNMIHALVKRGEEDAGPGNFYARSNFIETQMPDDFFSAIVSVSFSAFDPFRPMRDRPNRNDGLAYFYVGMKKVPDSEGEPVILKSHADLCQDFLSSLGSCFSVSAKKTRWVTAIERLASDDNFSDMNLPSLADPENSNDFTRKARNLFERMSSGHAIVLLTMTRLVETVDEKTLILMDEPESHLHPPLLSAFTRALSELLSNRNGVAIVATHSPVVVQEVPRTCVWTMERSRAEGSCERPELETFGENVGVLTREIFGLEVTRSGFHDLLRQRVEQGLSYEEVLSEYNGNLGFEALAQLRAMVAAHSIDANKNFTKNANDGDAS